MQGNAERSGTLFKRQPTVEREKRGWGAEMNSVAKHAVLTAASFVVGTFLVWWVEPSTAAGATFLVAGCVFIVNALGAVFWRSQSKTLIKIWIGSITAILLLSQTACETNNPHTLSSQEVTTINSAIGGALLGGLLDASGLGRGAAIGAAAGGAIGIPTTQSSNQDIRTPLRPTRAFLSASDIPPAGVGAYGVVALRTLPTPANHDRLIMLCRSFLASLPAQQTLPASVALKDQMITVWPLNFQPPQGTPQCDYLISNYDLYGGISAVEDAASQGHRLNGRGPFLIGWSPSTKRGKPDAVVLVIDMSGFETQASFDDAFKFWQDKVVEDPSLWRQGFRLERLRLAIRDFADHYGESILGALKFWRNG